MLLSVTSLENGAEAARSRAMSRWSWAFHASTFGNLRRPYACGEEAFGALRMRDFQLEFALKTLQVAAAIRFIRLLDKYGTVVIGRGRRYRCYCSVEHLG